MREPAEVFCLAEYLCEEMIAREWTAYDVGMRMGGKSIKDHQTNILTVQLMLAIQDDNCIFDDETLSVLDRIFGVSDGFFKRLDAPWRKWPDRRSPFVPPEIVFGP